MESTGVPYRARTWPSRRSGQSITEFHECKRYVKRHRRKVSADTKSPGAMAQMGIRHECRAQNRLERHGIARQWPAGGLPWMVYILAIIPDRGNHTGGHPWPHFSKQKNRASLPGFG